MERILVSACLLGRPVRYDGTAKRSDDEILARWRAEGRLLSCCPEVSGGLPVPRPAAEISPVSGPGGAGSPADAGRTAADGTAVLDGTARVRTADGIDVTASFTQGAAEALEVAQRYAVRIAVLKEGSPSCGSGRIYDGGFTGTSMPGFGVTTALLERNGIRVFNEDQLDAAAAYLDELESHH
ncbi:DUF523 domain-containing protein [Actinomadura sp. HBU206391]|uniref:DUF523 domain-containing protein n=1 Tax=Actinomadura sp. HBU206391 TaxID=2731692 RepID=UPI0016502ACB|nr:DUF523 domain-containing protein [Actinomadura sp. HBU206391]MBC6461980.1 DUF523 domain-containing protein [Actinomadura sp. HBU206391]